MNQCLVIDIDDTLFVHTSNQIEYSKIRPDNGLKAQLQRIQVPKFILTNATFEHANIVLNKMDVIDDIHKIYSRDNIPRMKPSVECYLRVQNDISTELNNTNNQYIFFDDLLSNLKGAKDIGWNTVWISPSYSEASKYPFVDRAYPSLRYALNDIHF